MSNQGFKGRFGEYAFASKAALHGLVIGFPSIESIPFDFFVDNGSQTFKVQVKTVTSTAKQQKLDFRKPSGGGRVLLGDDRKYSPGEVDFFVGFIEACGSFFIIPANELSKGLRFNIFDADNIRRYKNAWQLLTNSQSKSA